LDKEFELVKGCKKNDPQSQKELFSIYSTQMFRVANRYLSNSSEAEDIVVVAFTKIFKKIKSFSSQEKGSLEAWIRKIVVNECLMLLRTKHNFNLWQSIDDVTAQSDLQPIAALQAADIMEMVLQLPTGYRTVFNLHVVEGYNHAEIAEQLNIDEGTSRSQLFKAKELLRKMLAKENEYGT
jgi:RNA polymerase sigma-70 factor (ECF subfamily)